MSYSYSTLKRNIRRYFLARNNIFQPLYLRLHFCALFLFSLSRPNSLDKLLGLAYNYFAVRHYILLEISTSFFPVTFVNTTEISKSNEKICSVVSVLRNKVRNILGSSQTSVNMLLCVYLRISKFYWPFILFMSSSLRDYNSLTIFCSRDKFFFIYDRVILSFWNFSYKYQLRSLLSIVILWFSWVRSINTLRSSIS